MADVSFITTCKGRLDHLKVTLPLMLAAEPDEIIVVDYNCPQNAGDWVETNFPAARVVRVTDEPGFRLAHARNLGAQAARCDWLCFIDVDVKAADNLARWIRSNARPARHYRPVTCRDVDRDASGTVVVGRDDFERVGGYDEVISGWGFEDVDFYDRLTDAGSEGAMFPGELVASIPHSDAERTAFYGDGNKFRQMKANKLYFELKKQVAPHVCEAKLPVELRERLYREVSSCMAQGSWKKRKEFRLDDGFLRPAGEPDPEAWHGITVALVPRRRYYFAGPTSWRAEVEAEEASFLSRKDDESHDKGAVAGLMRVA